jgi:hypothetical protein
MTTVNEVIPMYIKLRDRIEEIEKRHKDELAPLEKGLKTLDAWLLQELDRNGVNNMAVKDVGTVLKVKQHKVSVSDWDATWQWITVNERYDLLNHAVNKTGVVAWVEETGAPPPGVNYSAEYVAQVRRARGT